MFNFSFRPHKEGLSKIFGELEAQIMEVLWRRGDASVRDVWEELNEKRPLAYTTVLSTMRNLDTKGYLHRVKSGVTHIYSPTSTQEELIRKIVNEVVDGLMDDFAQPFFARLADLKRKDDLATAVERMEGFLDKPSKEGKNP
ncbi:MAG: BlaI/MecI/CopY family transcriptional regulator [Negativicutes bacterium]|nr:BlaI/MecI/CopY family transcriptional regulator [Negativicutes bacterium]